MLNSQSSHSKVNKEVHGAGGGAKNIENNYFKKLYCIFHTARKRHIGSKMARGGYFTELFFHQINTFCWSRTVNEAYPRKLRNNSPIFANFYFVRLEIKFHEQCCFTRVNDISSIYYTTS